jgi:hypothetical protein
MRTRKTQRETKRAGEPFVGEIEEGDRGTVAEVEVLLVFVELIAASLQGGAFPTEMKDQKERKRMSVGEIGRERRRRR